MSQGLREMLANRRFAIPLIVLLAFCFVGLILVGVVLILKPGAPDADEPVALATNTPGLESTVQATSTQVATEAPTSRPTPTLVPLGTPADSGAGGTPVSSVGGDATPTLVPLGTPVDSGSGGTPVSSVGGDATATTAATAEPTATSSQSAEATAIPITDEELADTGIGWGLVLFAGAGLAMLAVAARRFRMVR